MNFVLRKIYLNKSVFFFKLCIAFAVLSVQHLELWTFKEMGALVNTPGSQLGHLESYALKVMKNW